jgi:hypothetical protein
MFGNASTFLGREEFGARGPPAAGAPQQPGSFYEYNDVRVNRYIAVAAEGLESPAPPEVLKAEIIGP